VAEKGIDEDTAFREILVRLTEKYPDVVPERVAAIVDGVRAEMSTAKVRDFVPVLAARAAKKRIKLERTPQASG
jgi:DNA polymerase IIIc chi subunit